LPLADWPTQVGIDETIRQRLAAVPDLVRSVAAGGGDGVAGERLRELLLPR
jgi:hypothetical protein